MNKFERLERWIIEVKEDPRTKLVEGKNDKKALNELGITNVQTLHKSLQETVTGINEAIILTDYDRKGEELKVRLEELFKGEGKRVDTSYRKQLRILTGLNYVEGLIPRYNEIKNKYRGETHGKNIHRYSKIHGSRSD